MLAATLSVLWDWVTGSVHFADPHFYQWADKSEIFRAEFVSAWERLPEEADLHVGVPVRAATRH